MSGSKAPIKQGMPSYHLMTMRLTIVDTLIGFSGNLASRNGRMIRERATLNNSLDVMPAATHDSVLPRAAAVDIDILFAYVALHRIITRRGFNSSLICSFMRRYRRRGQSLARRCRKSHGRRKCSDMLISFIRSASACRYIRRMPPPVLVAWPQWEARSRLFYHFIAGRAAGQHFYE